MFLPLGDAMVIIFTTPLFTVILSLLCFRIKIGLWKAGLCAVLFAGMILNIQPPFIFPTETPEPGAEATLVSQVVQYFKSRFKQIVTRFSALVKATG